MTNTMRKTTGMLAALLLLSGSTIGAFAAAEPAPYLRGDINRDGVVSVEDAQLALKAYTNLVAENPSGLNAVQFQAANVLQDSVLDVIDAQCILQYYVTNTVSQGSVSWDQLTGRDQLTVPDTGEELVIRAVTVAYPEAMIKQFVKRHPEYEGKIRMDVLLPDGGGWTSDEFEAFLANAKDTDLFMIDNFYLFNFLNNDDFSIPVSKIGFQESDFANMYAYTLEAGTSLNGELKALTNYASPSGFAYRTDLAEQYLGVKTPAEMQKLIGTWEDFDKAAKTVHDKTNGAVAFCDKYGGMPFAGSSGLTEPWFNEDNEIVIPEQMKRLAERYMSYTKNGYCCEGRIFSTEDWYDDVKNGALFGFFVPSWALPEYDEELNLMEELCGGKESSAYGKFNMVQGPAAYHWGGEYMLVSPQCDNKTLAYEFLRETMLDDDAMIAYAQETGNFINNSSAVKKLAASEEGYAALGGQKVLLLLDEIASACHATKEYTPKDADMVTSFTESVNSAILNDSSLDFFYQSFCATHEL